MSPFNSSQQQIKDIFRHCFDFIFYNIQGPSQWLDVMNKKREVHEKIIKLVQEKGLKKHAERVFTPQAPNFSSFKIFNIP